MKLSWNMAPAIAGLSAIFTTACSDQYGRPDPARSAILGAGMGAVAGAVVSGIQQQQYDNSRYNSGYNYNNYNYNNYPYQQPRYQSYPQQQPRYSQRTCRDRYTGQVFYCLLDDGRSVTIGQEVDEIFEKFPHSKVPEPGFPGT